MKTYLNILFVTIVFSGTSSGRAQTLMGTAFTYQGELTQNGTAVDDTCDFEFTLWDDPSSTQNLVAGPLSKTVDVVNGRFTVVLDFGGDAINGDARWLEINVCCPSGCMLPQNPLSPRQELTPTPHALALPGLRTQQNATSPNLIGGHPDNSVTTGVFGATIGGGKSNSAEDSYATISGGEGNAAGTLAGWSTIGGGGSNTTTSFYATIAGGFNNEAHIHDTVSGGGNNLATGGSATVSGGDSNSATDIFATVGGGQQNEASGSFGLGHSTVGGGKSNTASGGWSTIAGGESNVASGDHSVVAGGKSNEAVGNFSFAGGRHAKALHNGSVVWNYSDVGGDAFESTGPGQFLIRAPGGVGITSSLDDHSLDPDAALHVVGDVKVEGTVTTLGRTRRVFINPEAIFYSDMSGGSHQSVGYNGYATVELTPWQFIPSDNRYTNIKFNMQLPSDLKGTSVTYGILLMAQTQDAIELSDSARVYAVEQTIGGWNLQVNGTITDTLFSDKIVALERTITDTDVQPDGVITVKLGVRNIVQGNLIYVVGAYFEYTAE